MDDVKQIHCTVNDKPEGTVAERAVFIPGTAWCVPFKEASGRTANAAAKQFNTGDSIWYTKAMFKAFVAASARCAPRELTITTIDA